MPADGSILIVDDNRAVRDFLADALELEGYRVARAANGLHALTVLCNLADRRAAMPRLILLERHMPGLDGRGLVLETALRAIQVPIIAMTAAQDAKVWAEEIGAAGCLAKPFDVDDLFREVRRVIHRGSRLGMTA